MPKDPKTVEEFWAEIDRLRNAIRDALIAHEWRRAVELKREMWDLRDRAVGRVTDPTDVTKH